MKTRTRTKASSRGNHTRYRTNDRHSGSPVGREALVTRNKRIQQPKSPVIPDLGQVAVVEISTELKLLLADVFALYVKVKNFHWHMTGKHFRDYHLLLDEHGEQIFAMTDDIAERARKIGGTTLRSIGDIARHQRLKDNDNERLSPTEMLGDLLSDNRQLAAAMRDLHELCDGHGDVATTTLIENCIDQTERRAWFLAEIHFSELRSS
jgi:starvation-inducible DNA-binding protein